MLLILWLSDEAPRSFVLIDTSVIAPALSGALVWLDAGRSTALTFVGRNTDTSWVGSSVTNWSWVAFIIVETATPVDALVVRYSIPSTVSQLLIGYQIASVSGEETHGPVSDAVIKAT